MQLLEESTHGKDDIRFRYRMVGVACAVGFFTTNCCAVIYFRRRRQEVDGKIDSAVSVSRLARS
jgi:hypothetical protein